MLDEHRMRALKFNSIGIQMAGGSKSTMRIERLP